MSLSQKDLVAELSRSIYFGEQKTAIEILNQLTSAQENATESVFNINPKNEDDVDNFWLLHACSSYKPKLDVVKALYEKGAKLDTVCKGKQSPLIALYNYLYQQENIEIVLWLLKTKIPVNQICGTGKTAVTSLIGKLEHLTESDLDSGELETPTESDQNSEEPEHLTHSDLHSEESEKHSNIRIFNALLEYGADLNILDGLGHTPLTTAVSQENPNPSVIKLLLSQEKLDINIPNKQGQTALDILSDKGDFRFVDQFLQKGAIWDKNKPSFIPLMIAVQNNDLKQVQEFYKINNDKPLAKDPRVVNVFKGLTEFGKVDFALEMLKWPIFHQTLLKEKITDGFFYKNDTAIDKYFRKTVYELSENLGTPDRFPLEESITTIKILIRASGDYRCPSLTQELIKSSLSYFLLEEELDEFETKEYKEFIRFLTEVRSRYFIFHRFGLEFETRLGGAKEINTSRGNQFANGIVELQKSFRNFVNSKEQNEILKAFINQQLLTLFQGYNASDTDELIDKMYDEIDNLYAGSSQDALSEKFNQRKLVIIPVRTKPSYYSYESHAEAFAIYDDYLFTINRASDSGKQGICIYKIQNFNSEAALESCNKLYYSLAASNFIIHTNNILDNIKDFLDIVPDSFEHHARKEQSVGNCCWATSKLFVYLVTYVTILDYCKNKHIEVEKAKIVAQKIANFCYKLFTLDDRNNALCYYFSLHGFHNQIPATLDDKLHYISEFLEFFKSSLSGEESKRMAETNSDPIVELIQAIYVKILNQRFYQLFKEENSEALDKLLKQESENPRFQPLLYFVRNLRYVPVQLSMLDKLTKNKRWLNDCDNEGNTALHLAAKFGFYALCEKMISNQMNVKVLNNGGWTAFHVAINLGQLEIINLLLKTDHELLHMKIRHENKEIAPIQMACLTGNINTVKTLIRYGANVTDIHTWVFTEGEYLDQLKTIISEQNSLTLSGTTSEIRFSKVSTTEPDIDKETEQQISHAKNRVKV